MCYKSVRHVFALTMISEIGDVKRFPHPRHLVSWVGIAHAQVYDLRGERGPLQDHAPAHGERGPAESSTTQATAALSVFRTLGVFDVLRRFCLTNRWS